MIHYFKWKWNPRRGSENVSLLAWQRQSFVLRERDVVRNTWVENAEKLEFLEDG